jgi:uncharacterized damage-inducible protein DinB
MKVVDYVADSARVAATEAFRYAAAVPADKLQWVPIEGGRSVLSLVQELGMTPTWQYSVLAGPDTEEASQSMEEQVAMMAGWATIEACKQQFDERFEKLEAYVRTIPEERFTETKWLPYDGGRDFTVLEMLDYTRWNCNYHLGQIAYIQTLYGDKEMH